MVLMRAAAPSTYILAPRSRTPPILPIPLPTSLLPLPLPLPLPSTNRRADVPEAVLSPQKRLCIALGHRFEVGESSSSAVARSTRGFRADYGFFDTLDAEIRRDPNREVGYEITDVWVDPAKAAEEIPPTTFIELSRCDRFCHLEKNFQAGYDMRFSVRTMHDALLVERGIGCPRGIEDSDRLTQHIQHEHDRFREFQRTRDVAPEDADSSS
ncbi:hypothetical protein Tco_0741511 [Tanacetum coccineum]